ncbi:uncharacterized protein [Asterias amurensis]|uniref:uncharacterized protein isoform X2 n=1 Tax=Asterias amurensis TaxID=7602 RepID=UPI003AB84BAE
MPVIVELPDDPPPVTSDPQLLTSDDNPPPLGDHPLDLQPENVSPGKVSLKKTTGNSIFITESSSGEKLKEVELQSSDVNVESKEITQETTKKEENLDGYPRITVKSLQQHCKQHKLYRTPELNDVLYLHYKGYIKIENLDKYTGLKALYLECNGIRVIENFENQTEMRCLYLQQNVLKGIQNLESMQKLDTLNLSHNHIDKIENLACLPKLNTLQISHNRLSTASDIQELERCDNLSVVDMSHNRLEDPEIVNVLANMKICRVLNLMGNPVVKKIKNYRKTLILRLRNLTYLDDRPVFPRERACTEAWLQGGREAEKEERQRWINNERAKIQASVDALLEIRNRAQAARKQKEEEEEKNSAPETNLSPAEDEHLFTFDVSKAPSSAEKKTGMMIEEVTSQGDTKDQKKIFTTELYEEDDIETIDLREEKINIDDLPELEDFDTEEMLPPAAPRKMLIEEVTSVEQPRGKIIIEEINQSLSSAKITDQSNSSLLMDDEEPDDQSHPLIQETNPSKSDLMDQSEDVESMTSSSGASNKIPLIQEIFESNKTKAEAPSLIDELKKFGARIPNSWEVLENEKKRKEQEESDKSKEKTTEEKIWELAANAGSTLERPDPPQ